MSMHHLHLLAQERVRPRKQFMMYIDIVISVGLAGSPMKECMSVHMSGILLATECRSSSCG